MNKFCYAAILVMLTLFGRVSAQVGLTVVNNDGTQRSLDLESDGEIYITTDYMVVMTSATTGNTVSFDIANIRKVLFGDNVKINDVRNSAPLLLYPSPATDFFTVSGVGSEPKTMTIYDVHGRKVMQTDCKDGDIVDISHLANDIYLVRVADSFSKIIKK